MIDIITLETNALIGSGGLAIKDEHFEVLEIEPFSYHVRGEIPSIYKANEVHYLNILRFLIKPNYNDMSEKLAQSLQNLFTNHKTEIIFYLYPRSYSNKLEIDGNNEYEADLVAEPLRSAYFFNKEK